MKKFLSVIFLTLIISCSNDNYDLIQPTNNTEYNISNIEMHSKNWPCGPGYHLEFQIIDELVLFKKGGCNDGFGFCFGVKLNIIFDCIKDTIITTPSSTNVNYNDTSQYASVLGIEDTLLKEITFIFHKDIVNSSNHSPSDFTTLDIDDGVKMNNDIILKGGSYPKIEDGDFYKYIVPYK